MLRMMKTARQLGSTPFGGVAVAVGRTSARRAPTLLGNPAFLPLPRRLPHAEHEDYNCAMSDFKPQIRVFDRKQEFAVVERRLPHWSQSGTLSFITFRTWDSIPQPVLFAWLAQRDAWLSRHGVDPAALDWRRRLERLEAALILEFRQFIADRWNDHLDACHGECVLRRRALAEIVADSLRHFDGDRYELTDFVIMPNHVHLLAAFPSEDAMLAQCESWKRFTATKIHRAASGKGRFWQQDGFDHLVRSLEEFESLRQYIADNPRRAGLRDGEYLHASKPM
jgi:putative transposase